LYDKLTAKGRENGRVDWIFDECKLMERPEYYYQQPHKEALNSNLIRNVRFKEQVFLLRLFGWRNSEAARKNYSRDMILQKKLISPITKAMGAGRAALKGNRRIPERIAKRFADTFFRMYEEPATDEEREILKHIPEENEENLEDNIMTEMLHLIIHKKSLKADMSVNLVMPRRIIRDMKQDLEFFEPILENTWRKEFLGEKVIDWLKNRSKLEMSFEGGNFTIELLD